MKGTGVSSRNLSMANVIYCHQWLHLWHEALFMILLYKWPCFEVQKKKVEKKNIKCTTMFLQRIWNYVVFPWNKKCLTEKKEVVFSMFAFQWVLPFTCSMPYYTWTYTWGCFQVLVFQICLFWESCRMRICYICQVAYRKGLSYPRVGVVPGSM